MVSKGANITLNLKPPRKNSISGGRSRVGQQSLLLPKGSLSSGGILRNKRCGRVARALSVKNSMHLVLRSSKAKGSWSFTRAENKSKIQAIVKKHAAKNFIKVISFANVGNHLHLHIQLPHRRAYFSFIRAISGAIALTVTKANKLKKLVNSHSDRFWDYRPFTKVITSFKYFLNMKDYLAINRLEGEGAGRLLARQMLVDRRNAKEAWMLAEDS
jgi:REP element-mobilizing transposase RayT